VIRLRRLARTASLAATLSAVTLPAFSSPAPSGCVSTPADRDQVIQALRTMYAAATADDLARFHTVAAPDFYAFDGGKRYDGDALMNMVKSFHDQGYLFVWTVSDPQVEADCRLAWITYTNRGSIQDKTGTHPTIWLESAALRQKQHPQRKSRAGSHSHLLPHSVRYCAVFVAETAFGCFQ
jgi:hypothetical protein